MKKIFILISFLVSINSIAQSNFEKGYIINEENQKVEVFIKNLDWRNNPTEIEVKLSEESQSKRTSIGEINEFGIYGVSRFIKSTVNIDISTENVGNLDYDSLPDFEEMEVFLKVLVEGKANLYSFTNQNLRRYFYSIENSEIEQLIHKVYLKKERVDDKNMSIHNNTFKKQLWENLKCDGITPLDISPLEYSNKDLFDFFIDYNQCSNSEYMTFDSSNKKSRVHLNLRPRLNFSNLSVSGFNSGSFDTEINGETTFGIGLEAEVILPYNNNKWSLSIEPTFQQFNAETTKESKNTSEGYITSIATYNSWELPITLRYYIFFNSKSKLFLNLSLVNDFSYNSQLEYRRTDGSEIQTFEIKSRNNFASGLGYKYLDKYSLEFRYGAPRQLLENTYSKKSNFTSFSFILGYTIF